MLLYQQVYTLTFRWEVTTESVPSDLIRCEPCTEIAVQYISLTHEVN